MDPVFAPFAAVNVVANLYIDVPAFVNEIKTVIYDKLGEVRCGPQVVGKGVPIPHEDGFFGLLPMMGEDIYVP